MSIFHLIIRVLNYLIQIYIHIRISGVCRGKIQFFLSRYYSFKVIFLHPPSHDSGRLCT